jgi:hypothetical protein
MENHHDRYALATLAEIQNGFRQRQELQDHIPDTKYARVWEWAEQFFLTTRQRGRAAVMSVFYGWKYGHPNADALFDEYCFHKSHITIFPWIVISLQNSARDIIHEEVERQMWRRTRGDNDRDS